MTRRQRERERGRDRTTEGTYSPRGHKLTQTREREREKETRRDDNEDETERHHTLHQPSTKAPNGNLPNHPSKDEDHDRRTNETNENGDEDSRRAGRCWMTGEGIKTYIELLLRTAIIPPNPWEGWGVDTLCGSAPPAFSLEDFRRHLSSR